MRVHVVVILPVCNEVSRWNNYGTVESLNVRSLTSGLILLCVLAPMGDVE